MLDSVTNTEILRPGNEDISPGTRVQERYTHTYTAPARVERRRFPWLLLGVGVVLVLAVGQVIWWSVYMNAPVHSSGIWLEGARSMNVTVAMGSGDLILSGGAKAENAMNADFIYSVPEWEPKVSYEVSGDTHNGKLVIQQPDMETLRATNARSEWDVRLREGLPMTLDIAMGAGRVDIRLDNLAVTSMTVNNTGDDTSVDLTGDRRADMTAGIVTNVGKTTLVLPTDVGVRVIAQSTVGKIDAGGFTRNEDAYTNSQYGKSPVTLDIKVYSVTGDIELRQAK